MIFADAIERVLGHEGGYSRDPRDPGGETRWGISRRQYPGLDIRSLTREEAAAIYERDFWNPVAATVPSPLLRFQLLDAAVNHGMGNAVRMLQRAAGVAPDGHWGPLSQAALLRRDPRDVAERFLAERLDFCARLNAFDAFGRGWTRRIAQNLRYLAGDTP